MQDKEYQKIDADKEDPADEPIDAAGFTGQMSRQKYGKELKSFNEAQLILLFCKDSKITEMVRMIRTIDKMRNGFITKTELIDILKECYPE